MHDTALADRHASPKNGPYAAGAVRNAVYLEWRGKPLLSLAPGNVEQVAFPGLSLVIEQVQGARGIHDDLGLYAAVRCFLKGDRGSLGQ